MKVSQSINQMAVNSKLLTLMNVIEELQDVMPEGKYLEAMNALRDLHRTNPKHVDVLTVSYPNRIILTNQEAQAYRLMYTNRQKSDVQLAYEKDECGIATTCQRLGISIMDWMSMEDRSYVISQALMSHGNVNRNRMTLPDPSVCPFIARHAVGRWDAPDTPGGKWSCVCGSTNNLSKYWEKHRNSDRHKDWAKTRFVHGNKINSMMGRFESSTATRKTYLLGWVIREGSPYYCQTKNEWTHPELFIQSTGDTWLPECVSYTNTPPEPVIEWIEYRDACPRCVGTYQYIDLPPLPYAGMILDKRVFDSMREYNIWRRMMEQEVEGGIYIPRSIQLQQ
jgi:hypothetical protein